MVSFRDLLVYNYLLRLLFSIVLQGLHSILNGDMIKCWDDLYDETDSYTDRWLSSGKLPYSSNTSPVTLNRTFLYKCCLRKILNEK